MGDEARKLVIITDDQSLEHAIKKAVDDGLTTEEWHVTYWSSCEEQQSPSLEWRDARKLQECLQGVHTCVVMTHCDFSQPKEAEVEQGMAIGKAIKAAKVKHVIMSTQQHCERTIGIPAKHYDAKAEICEYMRRQLSLPVTAISIPPYYEAFLSYLKPQPHASGGGYEIVIPCVEAAPVDMISQDDIGSCLLPIIENPGVFIDKTVCLSGDKMSGERAARVFTEILKPLRFIHRQVTIQEFRDMDFTGSIDLANMFDLLGRTDQRISTNGTKELFPSAQNFATWASRNKGTLIKLILEQ